MHLSSLENMSRFIANYLTDDNNIRRSVLDFGSKNINGSYKPLFASENWEYTGMDQESGENVDLVVKNPHSWLEIPDSSFDIVISGQALEHVEFPWMVFNEIYRVLKPEGITCIIAPSSGPEHRYPIDCWRFYPDGMRSLCKFSGLTCLEVKTEWNSKNYEDGSEIWKDTILIAKKSLK